jgi:DNA replication and repair protein RecF
MHSLTIESLSLRSFRNLDAVDLTPGARFNVISGDNGQGKTNLLEAIYVVSTSRSFRANKPGDVVRHGDDVASVRARVREDDEAREQSMGLRVGGRAARIDGKRPASLAAYAVRTPVVVFHPGEVALSMGSGGERRRLLDRLALFVRASSMDELDRFARAMRERQRALETRGVSASDVVHWEELMVRHGVAVMDVRAEAASRLADAAVPAFERIAAPGLEFAVSYAPGAPRGADEYRAALAASRAVDLRRGGARVGPHRDDLALTIGGRPVRGVASQGQHRATVLALKSAELQVVGVARGARPILLLDDVSSELDRARTAALFVFLREQRGQVFLTTTRPELIEIEGGERADFHVESGRISGV